MCFKKEYLKLYSQFLDQKFLDKENMPVIPDTIVKFSEGKSVLRPYPQSAEEMQRNNNEGILWQQLVSFENRILDYLLSAISWGNLLKKHIDQDGLNEGLDVYSGYIIELKTQSQKDIFYELDNSINLCIIGMLTIKHKLIRIVIHSLPDIFSEYNKNIIYESGKIIKSVSSIKDGEIYKKLNEANTISGGKYKKLIDSFKFFYSDEEWKKLTKFRDKYIHDFGSYVGIKGFPLQIFDEYRDKNEKVIRQEAFIFGLKEQDYKHEELLETTMSCWKKILNLSEKIFNELYQPDPDRVIQRKYRYLSDDVLKDRVKHITNHKAEAIKLFQNICSYFQVKKIFRKTEIDEIITKIDTSWHDLLETYSYFQYDLLMNTASVYGEKYGSFNYKIGYIRSSKTQLNIKINPHIFGVERTVNKNHLRLQKFLVRHLSNVNTISEGEIMVKEINQNILFETLFYSYSQLSRETKKQVLLEFSE